MSTNLKVNGLFQILSHRDSEFPLQFSLPFRGTNKRLLPSIQINSAFKRIAFCLFLMIWTRQLRALLLGFFDPIPEFLHLDANALPGSGYQISCIQTAPDFFQEIVVDYSVDLGDCVLVLTADGVALFNPFYALDVVAAKWRCCNGSISVDSLRE